MLEEFLKGFQVHEQSRGLLVAEHQQRMLWKCFYSFEASGCSQEIFALRFGPSFRIIFVTSLS